MSAEPKRRYTLEEYLELDRASEEKYEYFNGETIAMTGGSFEHNAIAANLLTELNKQLAGRNCRALGSDMKLKVPAAPPYRYPDVSVVCGKPEIEKLGDHQLLVNPILIVEVLSPTTERFDRGDKFTFYQSIDSFREYLLIAQHRPHIGRYVRESDRSWQYTEMNDLAENLYLPSIDCTLRLRDVYQGIDFQS